MRDDSTNLILINISILVVFISLLLKGDDDQRNEDVEEEEWKDDEVDDVEESHLDLIVRCWTLAFCGRNDGVL